MKGNSEISHEILGYVIYDLELFYVRDFSVR